MRHFRHERRRWLRRAAAWACLASVSGVLTACQRPRPALRLGANLWPGYAAMRLVEETRRPSAPVRVLDFHATGTVLAAFRDGTLDMAAVTLDEALLLAVGEPMLRVPLVFDVSNGADVLVVRPGIERLQDLRGRRVGFESIAMGAYMTLRALSAAGLTSRDVTFVPVRLSEGADAFERGQVDALVTFEPVRTRLLDQGARVLFSSRDIPGEVVDVLVVRQRVMDERESELRTLLAAHEGARARLLAAPLEVARDIGPRIGLTGAQLQNALALMQLPDAAQSAALIRSPQALPATVSRLDGVMREHGLLAPDVPRMDLFEGVDAWLAA